MAGVVNHSARLYHLKTCDKGVRVKVSLKPGFNVVPDDVWLHFVDKNGKVKLKFLADLNKKKLVSYGSRENDMELDEDDPQKAMVNKKEMKVTPKKSKKDKKEEE
jgi:hypothetical protein